MDEEIKLFLKKITKLEDILKLLDNQHTQAVVQKVERRLQNIYKCIKNDASLNAGGKFEWVDSVLIKVNKSNSYCICLFLIIYCSVFKMVPGYSSITSTSVVQPFSIV